jgi:hypothetical protein
VTETVPAEGNCGGNAAATSPLLARFHLAMEDHPMTKTVLLSSALALSVLAVPAMAQGYYDRDSGSYSEAPISGAQMTDLPSMSYNTIHSGSFLSEGPRYGYGDQDYYRDRENYDRYRDYRARRSYDRSDDGY